SMFSSLRAPQEKTCIDTLPLLKRGARVITTQCDGVVKKPPLMPRSVSPLHSRHTEWPSPCRRPASFRLSRPLVANTLVSLLRLAKPLCFSQRLSIDGEVMPDTWSLGSE